VRRVPPELCAGLLEPERGREVGGAARLLAFLRGPLFVFKLVGICGAVAHVRIVARREGEAMRERKKGRAGGGPKFDGCGSSPA
jgi:hypothetical protein